MLNSENEHRLKHTFTWAAAVAVAISVAAMLGCLYGTLPSSAGWWQDPSLGNLRGAATGNNTIINSPYYNPNLPAGGITPYQQYYGAAPYGAAYGAAPVLDGGYVTPYGSPISYGGGYFGIRYGGTLMRYWRASSGYYYPWAYGSYPYTYAYPLIYQSGQATQASPPVTTEFRDMQDYIDDSKAKGRLSDGDYQHLNRRLHDLVGESEDIDSNGSNPDQDTGLQQDVRELGLEIAHRIKPES